MARNQNGFDVRLLTDSGVRVHGTVWADCTAQLPLLACAVSTLPAS